MTIANPVKPYTFINGAGNIADATQVNSDFDIIYSKANEIIGVVNSLAVGKPWYDVSEYASFSAALNALSTTECTLVISTDVSIINSETVPATICLVILRTGSVSIPSSKVLTISGSLFAGAYTIFTGLGSVAGLPNPMPEWWGAVAYKNGVTLGDVDSSAAIQAAIYSMSSSGDQYHAPKFLEGRYRCDSSITVPEGVSISGMGLYKTVFDFANAPADTVGFQITTEGSSFGFTSVFSGIGISTSSNGTGISTGGMSGINISSVWFSGVDGINVEGNADIFVTNCVFESVRGIVCSDTAQDNNLSIINNFFSGMDTPITLKTVSDVRISGNQFRETRGVDIRFVTGDEYIQRIMITGNQFYNGVGVGGEGQINILLAGVTSNVKITSNIFEGANANSIEATSGTLTDIDICDNTFRRVTDSAIYFSGVGNNFKIDNNTFDTSIGKHAVYIWGAGTEYHSVSNNFIKTANDDSYSGNSGAAVYLANIAFANFIGNVVTASGATKGCYISVPNIVFNSNYDIANSFDIDASNVVEQMGNLNMKVYVTAMPTSGSYTQGDMAINKTPTAVAPVGYWLRLTTGSNHVLDTDWAAK